MKLWLYVLYSHIKVVHNFSLKTGGSESEPPENYGTLELIMKNE